MWANDGRGAVGIKPKDSVSNALEVFKQPEIAES
jgi:hypothetical protein